MTRVVVQPVSASTSLQATQHAVSLTVIGTRGPQGPIGPTGSGEGGMLPQDYFAVANRFFEIAGNPTAQAQARVNLDIQNVDGGTF
jgi:hypothetical protein